ncbi:helix-turn-helix domain-containing protein [Aurantimonas aggregata]|uniref:Helix-turn-helix domain-containing protein n=1 Tax=Aurantimonas aggregata TaxID=2047720 RepID=A0A6L9MJI9_9HYPH|nr:helix-turn-helix domain-containing protein [Aurantimonas aggregata]NDV87792.1 helix-turn-helix domain-containing protein [Aurantimonas aggregata]
MSKAAFDKIAEGLGEAIEIARGDLDPVKLHVPSELDVRDMRQRLGMSQDAFASAFGFTINQIREWEQGRARPLGGVRAYLMLIERSPESILALLQDAGAHKAA